MVPAEAVTELGTGAVTRWGAYSAGLPGAAEADFSADTAAAGGDVAGFIAFNCNTCPTTKPAGGVS